MSNLLVQTVLLLALVAFTSSGYVRMGSYGKKELKIGCPYFSSLCFLVGYKCVSDCQMKGGTNYYWCDAEHPTRHYKGDCKFLNVLTLSPALFHGPLTCD